MESTTVYDTATYEKLKGFLFMLLIIASIFVLAIVLALLFDNLVVGMVFLLSSILILLIFQKKNI